MPGIIIRYEVAKGQAVKAGDTIVILEAMKMESVLPAPIDGTVKDIMFKPGDRVVKDDVIAVIG
jgi:biotin carboxyl carrier protein